MSEEPAYQRFDCTGPELPRGSAAARAAIESGGCVVLPTDTVYGIGADAFDAAAVQRLLEAKGRGRDMPPPVLIGEPAILRALASDVPDQVDAVTAAHWPGPLTVICTAHKSLQMDLGDTDGTIALRVPDHEVARALLRRTGPLAVSSANRSGEPAATDVDTAIEQLGGSVSVYLDAGPTPGPVASSIVDFTRSADGVLVREGVLSFETLRETLPELVMSEAVVAQRAAAAPADEPAAQDEPDTEPGSDETSTDAPAVSVEVEHGAEQDEITPPVRVEETGGVTPPDA